jgi:type IV secretory pathway TraG/TraD family ATPase VirD4
VNALASLLERIAIGPAQDPADTPVADFRNGRRLTHRELTESALVVASPNKGKTTLARTIYRAMLRNGYGGLVLAVKESQVAEFQALCKLEDRERDCMVLGPGTGHAFNPLLGEAKSAEAAALIGELAEVLSNRVRDGSENDAFWRAQLAIILRNLFTLCRLVHGRHDILAAAELFEGRANTVAEIHDPSWLKSSPLAAALVVARGFKDDPDALLAVDYFEKTYPTHGERLQGSLAATVSGVFDYLRRPPLRDLFAGESTFSVEDLLENGKICIVGLPALDSADGRIANAVMQFCFCRAATRRTRTRYTFLISDECQETVSRELMRKLAVLREFKVASIMLTQNLAVLDDRLGETAREGFCGLLALKIFGPQGHAAARQWAAEQIGKRKVPVETKARGSSAGVSNKSTSEHEVWDYRVPPGRFAKLDVGETICLRDGAVWSSRWHKDSPGKRGTVRIA